jgi:hypothetical protein
MAMNPDIFGKAMGKPMGGATPPPPPGGSSMDDIFGEAAQEGESPDTEMAEKSIDPEIMSALTNATPEQLDQVKEALGLSGGMRPEGGMGLDEGGEGEAGALPPPAAPKPTSKLAKMFGGK